MCGSPHDALKTRQHEFILFNVTYENYKISYSFMVNKIFLCVVKYFYRNFIEFKIVKY